MKQRHLLPKKYIIVSDGSWKPKMGSEILKKYRNYLFYLFRGKKAQKKWQ